MLNEGYPPNWRHAVIHLNPETGEMHSDGDHYVRLWIQKRIGPHNKRLHLTALRSFLRRLFLKVGGR